MNNRPLLFSVDNLTYHYLPDKPVLAGITLDVFKGESLAILGANGSGKSTLLKLLSGLIYPNKGQITAFGHILSEATLQEPSFLQLFRQKVGFVFQNSDAQLFSATVWDELAFAPLQAGLSKEETTERVAEVAALLGIEPLLERPPYRLSGGEKKKVALACVLSVNPEVLFLDEPTNGLDPRTQFWLVEFLVALKHAGKTIITATHDLTIVEDIAERAIVVNENHTLAADGPVLQILSDRQLLLAVNLIHERSHFHVGGNRQHG